MRYEEKQMDLFKVPHISEYEDGYLYAHCIASDFRMGAGVAVPIAKQFHLHEALSEVPKPVLEHPTCILTSGVFNLITKNVSNGKPKYEDLIISLKMMRNQCILGEKKKIAMPKIGCGIDGLSWFVVSALIKDIFKDTDVKILVCYL